MEAPVSASLGVVRSLPAKLQQLLSPEVEADDGLRLRKAEKSKVRLLKDLLQELIDKYLMEPWEAVEAPAATARCWVKEVRELSYDIDDFLHELIHCHHTDSNDLRAKIPWLRQGLTRSRWIADQVSQFRARLRDAIRRHKNYDLNRRMMLASSIASEIRPLPPTTAPLIGLDGSMEKIQEWLIGDGEGNLRMVSIVGLGGVGKTTLAKELYSKVESQFECRAFVRTSQKPDVRKLLASILLQVRPERPPDANSESGNLIVTIRAHLQHKKYFIIIDDLWASSTWDIVCRALPDNKCFSRVLTTTEIDVVAQRCCGHNSEYIFKMGPLRQDEARTLFFSRFPGDQSGSCDQAVLSDIVRKCGGFPLATVTISSLLAGQHSLIEQCNYIRRSLSSNLRTNPSMEGMKQVLTLCYNNLPCRLKACMLYISIYKEGHIIWKYDLVKQWIAEGFICAEEGKNMEDVASAYFDELLSRGLIQPEDINYSGEVLSCTVHYIILNLIRYMSVEENFVTAIDCTQTKIRLADKVRRLSLLFGDADAAEQPANLRLSNVRSLMFDGLFKILPSIVEFRHLRVLILHIWGDQDNISFDLTSLCELFGLRYLEMVCNVTLDLQTEMQGLKYLDTLTIDSRVIEVPQSIVHLPSLLHLSLPGGTNLPNGIERLATLQTFGCFDLTSNSPETVRSLGELTNIRDLRLTCSEPQSNNLKNNMDQLSSVISNLRYLKSLTMLPSGSYNENTQQASAASGSDISFDLSNMSSPSLLLEKLELMPRICILSVLPKWIGELRLLSILKIEVMGLSGGDIDILGGLPALTVLSLYVLTVPAERIIFHKDGFPVLKHLMFICPALCVAFVEGAMPNIQRLKLGFNANTTGNCSMLEAGLENLAVLEVLCAQIGGPGAYGCSTQAVQSVLEDTFRRSRSPPIINIQLVDWVFYSAIEKSVQRCWSLNTQIRRRETKGQKQIMSYKRRQKNRLQKSFQPKTSSPLQLRSTVKQGRALQPWQPSWMLAPSVKKLITDMAQEEVFMLLGVSSEITKLEDNMEGLKAFLADAERRRITDKSVQRWTTKLKNAMYDAADILDLCQLEADKRRESRGGSSVKHKAPSCFQPVLLWNPIFAHKIGSRIKEINQRLEGIHMEADRYKFNIGLGSYPETRMQTATERYSQKMTSEFNESSVVGKNIEMDTKELGQLLITNDSHDIKMVSILGRGGMGKTTLADKIFNETTIQQHFKLKIWLSITQLFNEVELLRTAIEQAGGDPGGVQDKTLLTRNLTNTLSMGKFLLVLDDVWSDEAWNNVLSVPVKNASQKQQGNWILITTRMGHIAQRMGAFYQHRVSPLNDEDAWALLNKQLPPSPSQVGGNSHLKDIGMEIVQKCDGLPLAIKVMGGLLSTRSRTEGEWQAVLNHYAWSVAGLSTELDSCIYLSYEDLSPQLKQCFLYCSLFPKGTVITWREIIPMWISEGFVQPQDGSSSNEDQLEEIATEYYHELITRNLIEPIERSEISKYHCTMHDVVRQFAEFMAREDSLVVQDQHVACGSKGSVIHLSIGPAKLVLEWADLQKQDMLRTLIINCKINFKPGDSLTRFSRLRVLSIKDGDCDMLVGSLCRLRHLRYLCLENTNISRLPDDIHTIKFLQHILIGGSSSLENLPRTIIKLVQLRTLDMYDSNVNVVIPKGFAGLTNLRTLCGFPVHMEMDGDGNWCSLEEIGPLSQLRMLTLHGLENVPASSLAEMAMISSKEHLDYFGLNWSSSGFMELRDEINKQQKLRVVEEVIEKLSPPFSIRHLSIKGYFGCRLPNWMMVPATWVFKSLKLLRMDKLCCCTQLPNGLCQLPCLESLHINDAPAIRSVGPEFQSPSSLAVGGGIVTTRSVVGFPNLATLHLADLCEWEEWDWEEDSESSKTTKAMPMPTLIALTIENCKLSCLPPGLACSRRHALREVDLYKLSNLTYIENFPSVVELKVLDCPKLKMISNLFKLQKIEILYCSNVEVLQGVPSLDSMDIHDDTMETVPEYVTTASPRYLKLTCSKKLYESLLTGSNSSEYDKVRHIMSCTIDYIAEDED